MPSEIWIYYFNCHKFYSVVLQGIADSDKKFLVIEMGEKGKQSGAGVIFRSTIVWFTGQK